MLKTIAKLHIRTIGVSETLKGRLSDRRAAGFLEYSLLALAALAIFVVISKFFIPAVNNVFIQIVDTLKGASSVGKG